MYDTFYLVSEPDFRHHNRIEILTFWGLKVRNYPYSNTKQTTLFLYSPVVYDVHICI